MEFNNWPDVNRAWESIEFKSLLHTWQYKSSSWLTFEVDSSFMFVNLLIWPITTSSWDEWSAATEISISWWLSLETWESFGVLSRCEIWWSLPEWYGASQCVPQSSAVNLFLRLFLYQCHKTSHNTHQTATNFTSMVAEDPLAPPATWIWSIHIIQCVGDPEEGLGERFDLFLSTSLILI